MFAKNVETVERLKFVFVRRKLRNSKTLRFRSFRFFFSSKGILSTRQHTDSHPCTRPGWSCVLAGTKIQKLVLVGTVSHKASAIYDPPNVLDTFCNASHAMPRDWIAHKYPDTLMEIHDSAIWWEFAILPTSFPIIGKILENVRSFSAIFMENMFK